MGKTMREYYEKAYVSNEADEEANRIKSQSARRVKI